MKTIQFRPLRANEANLGEKMIRSAEVGDAILDSPGKAVFWGAIHVAYRYQEHREGVDYTVALVRLGDGSVLVGASKRHPTDPRNRIRGEVEALKRAFASSVVFELPSGGSEPSRRGIATAVDVAKDDGANCYAEGVSFGDCPYEGANLAEAWRQGWRRARREEGLGS